MKPRILRIAIPTPLRGLFDYLPPCDTNLSALMPGVRVRVPFGTREQIGILVATSTHSDFDPSKLKHAYSILDEQPLFPDSLLKLIHWASNYYHGSLGEIFEACLPSWLRKGKESYPIDPSLLLLKATTSLEEPYPDLNVEQQHAVDIILKSTSTFQTFLLEGITGSGKTEVYMRLIEHCLQQQLQALVLVPEIGLTPQMLSRFQSRFKVPIAVLHSSISEKKRFEAWQLARQGDAPIVIGTRSAAFTPLKSPGLFIIDEEHDASFKQQDSFRYSARDLLIRRAQIEQCPIVLGSATPSLETRYNAEQQRYMRLSLPTRAGNAKPPVIHVLDTRHKRLDEGLSAQLIKHVRDHLQDQGQVLLFLNRRGFSPVLMCFDCGFVANCKQCDARLTVHHKNQQLKCHHCESTIPLYKHCPECQNKDLQPLGVGTERVENVLKIHFPNHEIIRIDRDTTRRKGKMKEVVERIHNNEAHILLGTQMIAKGHHFPNVTLVGILDIDGALFSTDFRSLERLGQLVTQVAGRAGRAERLGQVVLQTCHPEHPLLRKLLEQGYGSFADRLLIERRATGLPPFSYQALIRAEAKKSEHSLLFLKKIKDNLRANSLVDSRGLKILGPIAAPMERRIGQYRSQLLLQSDTRLSLQKVIKHLIATIESNAALSRSVRWSLDVDPIDMY
jgi:primosomal protein N' (replication factor Y)